MYMTANNMPKEAAYNALQGTGVSSTFSVIWYCPELLGTIAVVILGEVYYSQFEEL